MRRVSVIGPGGAGKTTLARRLAERTGLPLVHLDRLYWRPGWRATPSPEWRDTVSRLVQGEHWILDGHYGSTLDLRLEASDTIVFLDLPRGLCLRRVVQRQLRFFGRPRPELAPGCPERLSLEFLGWIWTFRWRRRGELLATLDRLRSTKSIVVLETEAAVERFIVGVRARRN